MVNPQDATEVVPYLTSAATIYFVQKNLKRTHVYQSFVGSIPGADKWAHWLAAGAMSLSASMGIHMVWNCSLCAAYDPYTGGTGLLHLPSIFDIGHGIADWWKVYVLQQTVHEVTSSRDQSVFTAAITGSTKGTP